ncbi:putative membrane protein YczE [Methanomicrobium sp. W14]|uniref:YczE/YyaS/YitT family protein n=1 Tax=Methanomicrobium sp. W14 TaxID=2817839 RepID=UPI001FDA6584|nr:DUF6198 family protein [Methanomicrobium sp. W14]MBP2133621.1 putative membrane protein YczE [Methanomicrobium sp. W14]
MVTGLFLTAAGIALSTKADLGTSPVSCIPYVLSLGLPLTIGEWTFIMNSAFIFFQYLILRDKFPPYQLAQVLITFVFSAFIDLNMMLMSDMLISGYLPQWIFCLLSCVLIALGVCFLLKAHILMLAAESLILVISKVLKAEYGRIKVFFDSSMVIIAALLSFIFMGYLAGVREGTIAAALLIGTMVRYMNRLSFFKRKPD